MTPRRYDLFLAKSQRFQIVSPVILLGMLSAYALIRAIFIRGDAGESSWGIAVPFVGICLGVALLYYLPSLSIPKELNVTSDGLLCFRSTWRQQTIAVGDIVSIEPDTNRWLRLSVTVFLLTHRSGKLRFVGQFSDQHKLIGEILEANPAVVLKGC